MGSLTKNPKATAKEEILLTLVNSEVATNIFTSENNEVVIIIATQDTKGTDVIIV